MQRVIEQLWPEYIRPVKEGRIEAAKQQQLYAAFRDKAVAAKELFESGLQNHASLSASAGCVTNPMRPSLPVPLSLACPHANAGSQSAWPELNV